jgi:hypothetical protein
LWTTRLLLVVVVVVVVVALLLLLPRMAWIWRPWRRRCHGV